MASCLFCFQAYDAYLTRHELKMHAIKCQEMERAQSCSKEQEQKNNAARLIQKTFARFVQDRLTVRLASHEREAKRIRQQLIGRKEKTMSLSLPPVLNEHS